MFRFYRIYMIKIGKSVDENGDESGLRFAFAIDIA